MNPTQIGRMLIQILQNQGLLGEKKQPVFASDTKENLLRKSWVENYPTIPVNETIIRRLIGKRSYEFPREDAHTLTLKYRAFPHIDADLRPLNLYQKHWQFCYNVVAVQTSQAEKNHRFEVLKKLRSRDEIQSFLSRFEQYNHLPAALQRELVRTLSDKSKKCPKPKDDLNDFDFCWPIPFNGNRKHRTVLGATGSLRNSYCEIGDKYNPSNHSGTRKGKYRQKRELRRINLRPSSNQPWFSFDVLIDSRADGLLNHDLVGAKILFQNNQWYIAFIATDRLPTLAVPTRKYAGIDFNLRKRKHIHIGDDHRGEVLPYRSFGIVYKPNRAQNRTMTGKSQSEFSPLMFSTPAQKKRVQADISKKLEETKELIGKDKTKLGWRGLAKMLAEDKIPTSAFEQVKQTLLWYSKASSAFRYYSQKMTIDQERRIIAMAKEIVAYARQYDITDIGIPNDDIKGLREKEHSAGPRWKQHIENVVSEEMQIFPIGKMRTILRWELKKAGIRVHLLQPEMGSKLHFGCGAVSDNKNLEYIKCTGQNRYPGFYPSGCNETYHRDQNACANHASLARECSNDDPHPRVCSRDGKLKEYIGLPHWKAVRERCEEEQKRRRSQNVVEVEENIEENLVAVAVE